MDGLYGISGTAQKPSRYMQKYTARDFAYPSGVLPPGLTARNAHLCTAFNDTTSEYTQLEDVINVRYGGAQCLKLRITVYWMAASATSGAITVGVAAHISGFNADLDLAPAPLNETTTTFACPAVSGQIQKSVILFHVFFSSSEAPGYNYQYPRLMHLTTQVYRSPASAGDTMVGDAQFLAITVEEAA